MKKSIKVLCILIIVFSIALGILKYISKNNKKDNVENQNKTEQVNVNTNENTFENKEIESVINNIVEEQNTTNIIEDTKNDTENTNSQKGWVGNKYIDESKNITFNLPTDWKKYTEEEIEELLGNEAQDLTEEEKSNIDKYLSYDMVVIAKTGTSNLIITSNEVEEEVSANQYLTELKRTLGLIDMLDYETGNIYSEKICGVDYETLDVELKGYELKQHYYVRKAGKELVTIIITTNSNENLEKILKCFE